MDFSRLSAQDLLQLHSFITRIQQPTGGQDLESGGNAQDHQVVPGVGTPHNFPGNLLNPPLPANVNINHLQQTVPNTNPLINSMLAGPIQPYQSVRTTQSLPAAPMGHPSPTAALTAASSSMQPFLGRDTLAVNMAGQVNQERRASAAARLPRRQTVPTRGVRRRRGPATPAPSLARGLNIDDCLINIPDENGGHALSIRVKVKVYPPQVSIDLLSIVT